jgi:hypothetical protein
MNKNKIRHMVIFNLKHDVNGTETEKFLKDGEKLLSSIPVVENFEVLRQVSPKNDYDFGFSMEFSGKEAYEAYNSHSIHVDFVENRWKVEVEKFLEIDFEAL